MTVGLAGFHKAVATLWDGSGLDAAFQTYWPSGASSKFVVLNETEAEAAQPFPYCIFETDEKSVKTRMSSNTSENKQFQIHEVPTTFKVYANAKSGSSAKQIATDLVEEILKVFGGHPTTESPAADGISMDHGCILQFKYQTEQSVRQGTEEHMCSVRYLVDLDVPVIP